LSDKILNSIGAPLVSPMSSECSSSRKFHPHTVARDDLRIIAWIDLRVREAEAWYFDVRFYGALEVGSCG